MFIKEQRKTQLQKGSVRNKCCDIFQHIERKYFCSIKWGKNALKM